MQDNAQHGLSGQNSNHMLCIASHLKKKKPEYFEHNSPHPMMRCRDAGADSARSCLPSVSSMVQRHVELAEHTGTLRQCQQFAEHHSPPRLAFQLSGRRSRANTDHKRGPSGHGSAKNMRISSHVLWPCKLSEHITWTNQK